VQRTDTGEFKICGIVGMVSGFTNGFSHQEASLCQDMLFLDTLRGLDSTGVFSVDKNNTVLVHKAALNGLDFVCTNEFKSFKAGLISKGKFFVGHNRAATRGSVSDKNAHPFVVNDNIILVQNGTYKGSHHHHKNTDVDTEAIAHVIAENEDVSTALKKINAAYALVWYNRDKQTLNIIRNTERPLFVAYPKTGGVVWASEAETILWAASRNKIELKEAPYLLKEFNLCEFTLKKGGEYDTNYTELDAKYSEPPFHYKTHQVVPFVRKKEYIQQQHPSIGAKAAPGPNAVQLVFHDYLIRFRQELLVEDAELDAVRRSGIQVKKDNEDMVYIDLYDYVAANNHPHCTTWYVYGSTLGSVPPEEQIIVYWLVQDKTEEEVIHYTSEGIYEVKLNAIHTVGVHKHGENKHVVHCFASNPVRVESHTTQEVIEVAARMVH